MAINTRPTRERRLPAYLEKDYILDVDFRKNYKKTLLKEHKKAERLAKQLEKAKARKQQKVKAARRVTTITATSSVPSYTSTTVPSYTTYSASSTHASIYTSLSQRNIKNEMILGTTCAEKWSISKCSNLTLSETSRNRFLSSCKYHPGKIHNPEHRPTVEIVFTFDTTGSMYSAISELKMKLEALVSQLLNDLPGIRIAIIAHGDYCDVGSYDVVTKLDFSNDVDTLVQFVKAVPSTGGGDAPEAYELALKECSTLNWYQQSGSDEYDDNISRVVVMIGDDVPHKPHEHYKIDWRQELKNLHERLMVRVYGVQCLGRSYADSFYQELADATYGTRLELSNFSHMHELILGLCYRESAEHASIQFANNNTDSNTSTTTAVITTVAGSDSMTSSTETTTVGSTLTDEEMMQIHRAIHDATQRSVTIRGIAYEISVNPAECRHVRVLDIVYIEQNKTKNTKYAIMAREGAKVTWITHKGAWSHSKRRLYSSLEKLK